MEKMLKKNPDIVWMDVSDVDVVVRVKEEEATKTFKGHVKDDKKARR